MLVTSFSQAEPKRSFTTNLADGRVGWIAVIRSSLLNVHHKQPFNIV